MRFISWITRKLGTPPIFPNIYNLFWSPNVKYKDRFKLATFVQNNPLPRHTFFRWIDHIGQCRDIAARKHIKSLFDNWDRGLHHQYHSLCIINQRFETLSGSPVNFNLDYTPADSENIICQVPTISYDDDRISSDSDLDNPKSNFYKSESFFEESIPCGQTLIVNSPDSVGINRG